MSVVGVANAHSRIIKAMKALGYTSNEDGICRGFASMGVQATLAKDLPLFNQRLQLLLNIPVEELPASIEEVKKKSTKLVNEAKLAGIPLKEYNVDNQLTSDEKALLDILSLFDGIELYHQSKKYEHLYEKGVDFESQNLLTTAPIITSNKLKMEGGILQSLKFASIYNEAELTEYFTSLKEAYKNTKPPFNQPISLILTSVKHAITVGYNGKDWIFIDANTIPTQYITDESTISKYVLKTLSQNENACVSTEVYSAGNHQAALTPILNAWQRDKRWQNINKITPDKAKRYDSLGHKLIDVAIAKHHLNIIEQYVNDKSLGFKSTDAAKSIIDIPYLYLGILSNNPQIVKILLKLDIDAKMMTTAFEIAVAKDNNDITKLIVNDSRFLPNGNGNSEPPLNIAIVKGNDELVKMLLADKRVDPTIKNMQDGIDALGMSAAKGIAKNVKLFLEHPKIKIDKNYFKSSHPLNIACESGYPEVIALLLNKLGVDLKRTYSNGMTAVQVCYYSLVTKNVDTAKKLFSNEATIILPANYSIKEVLYEACQRGHLEIVKDILKRNTTLLSVPNDLVAKKAFQHAIDNDHIEVLKLLLKNIPPLDYFTINHYLLTAAKEENKPEIVALIKEYELKQNQQESPILKKPRPLPVPPKKAPLLVKKVVTEAPKPKVSDDKKPNTPRFGGNKDT